MRHILFFLAISTLVGCGSTMQFIDEVKGTRNTENVFLPDIKQITSSSLGERLMYQANGTYVDCITPLTTKSETSGLGSYTVILKQNIELCSNAVGSNKYYADYDVLSYNGLSANFNRNLLEEKLNDGTSNLCWTGSKGYCLNFKEDELKRRTKFEVVANTLQQSIEYMGSDGDVAKFIYSEFSGDTARPAFNREFQVDLSIGNTLNFKGAEVEIISATNTTIKYKVLKYFN